MPKVRLDQLLVTRGLAPTRARAQALVLAGDVYVRGGRVDKAGTLVAPDVDVEVRTSRNPYVSRGGIKLAGALDAFGIDPTGMRCLDLGASTGGFTDCLLQRGAARVVAVDVGYGQLAQKLRDDPRVVVMERTNARDLDAPDVGGAADLTVVDASFIGLGKLAPAIARCTREGGELVALVKPQFEVGRERLGAGGVVRDPALRAEAVRGVAARAAELGLGVRGVTASPLPGPSGNVEYFLWLRRDAPPLEDAAVERAVAEGPR